ncbi:MAG TPA: glycosyltransferase [Acidobacteriota bacterium]|nr:glycosyltransferase [Acidobacteriota bacterium]
MKVSLIIAVYDDVGALDLIMSALRHQTYGNFEVVVAEDGESPAVRDYVGSIRGLDVRHTTQEDRGIRKARSLNNGIIAGSGDYLVFLDGDCVPYSTFLEYHVRLAEPRQVLTGRRVNLGPRYSEKLRKHEITSLQLEKTFLVRWPLIALDARERHSENGITFTPGGRLYRLLIKNQRNTSLLGCNFSCFRETMFAVNGYDEAYGETSYADDTDLEWRFKAIGMELRSCKNVANIFHLYHSRSHRKHINEDEARKRYEENRRNRLFECRQGIKQH